MTDPQHVETLDQLNSRRNAGSRGWSKAREAKRQRAFVLLARLFEASQFSEFTARAKDALANSAAITIPFLTDSDRALIQTALDKINQ